LVRQTLVEHLRTVREATVHCEYSWQGAEQKQYMG